MTQAILHRLEIKATMQLCQIAVADLSGLDEAVSSSAQPLRAGPLRLTMDIHGWSLARATVDDTSVKSEMALLSQLNQSGASQGYPSFSGHSGAIHELTSTEAKWVATRDWFSCSHWGR